MTTRVQEGGLQVDSILHSLINEKIIPGTGIKPAHFWQSFEKILIDLSPINKALLAKREQLQQSIDDWHKAHSGQALNFAEYKSFLLEIGYLVPEGEDFEITTQNVEPEIATQAGPQLVVPIMNARFALNAANARWGSLYDAFYGTDLIGSDNGTEKTANFNQVRADKVRQLSKEFLDNASPLYGESHSEATAYAIEDMKLVATLKDGDKVELADPAQLVGYRGEAAKPTVILLKHNNLHIEIEIDNNLSDNVDPTGIIDINLEAALSTIMDCEDSVAAVDGADKSLAYSNWLGLMKGDLEEQIQKAGNKTIRRLKADREYTNLTGDLFSLKGRSMLFVRNVGHLMTSPAILDSNNDEIPEGIMDGMITSLAAIHDLKGSGDIKNSQAGSINIVKPKMHGPEEVAFTNQIFNRIEDALGLDRFTLKVGIMDEERRTSVNLKECIRAVKDRVVFINTGFLDRTGDEIHTSMEAGPMVPKAEMKAQKWISAYEDSNVDIGLACGLQGKAQIGKGMWAEPDNMAKMMLAKIGHPMSGANTAWVPSPTAATLHALHYHQINVSSQQDALKKRIAAKVDDILSIPLLGNRRLREDTIQKEIDNNAQGILGYVVRWIDQGVGCSKVPDINNIGLMEDRATLRISSQHIANWLHHGICNKTQVMTTMKRMAAIVDNQNSHDKEYINMAPHYDGVAFKTACALVFDGCSQPSGYTEPLLHAKRLELKANMQL